MKKHLINLITLLFAAILCQAQPQPQQRTQPFGQVDTADLKLTDCSFEKGAHAMILFDKADMVTSFDSVVVTRHKRIKIFSEFGKDQANIRLPFIAFHNYERIPFIEAQTIRLENGKIIITKVDPTLIYTENIDKARKALVFAFPEVRPGCIIEYRYKWRTIYPTNVPNWFFQQAIPSRYSELNVSIPTYLTYTTLLKGFQPLLTDTSEVANKNTKEQGRLFHWNLANVHSLVDEPYPSPGNNGAERMIFQLHSMISPYGGYISNPHDSWSKIAHSLLTEDDFKKHLDLSLSKQSDLLKHADSLKTTDAKIAYFFNTVKKTMAWDNEESWYASDDGPRRAWKQKKGNSADINLCLYNLLKSDNIDVYPMLVTTRDNGAISPDYADISQVNKLVVYVPVDSTKYYVLDASGKYNIYNEVPAELLNTYGIQLVSNKLGGGCKTVFLKNPTPALLTVKVNGEISADSKVHGETDLTNFSYSRAGYKEAYEKMGAEKYTEFIRGEDNSLKITNLKLENMDADSLPLVQHFSFNVPLKASDDDYIYFNPSLFNPIPNNPFITDQRFTDIDMAYARIYIISGRYKMPAGYNIDALPKDIAMNMEDKSITFRRAMRENDGYLELNYSISCKRSQFNIDEYKGMHDFYKKMFQFINEPVVLKKKKA